MEYGITKIHNHVENIKEEMFFMVRLEVMNNSTFYDTYYVPGTVLSALSIISVNNTTEEEQGMAGSGKAERQREEFSGEGIRSLSITLAI